MVENNRVKYFLKFNFYEAGLSQAPGVPKDPPKNEQNPYIQGGLLAPLGDPKLFKYFFHMVII
jgi:hypothetical protein